MAKVHFHDRAGKPVVGAIVAITSAPAEITDIGYVTDDDGAISVSVPAPGTYGFILTAADGGRLTANAQLTPEGAARLVAHPAQ